jgi:hypothetical protein
MNKIVERIFGIGNFFISIPLMYCLYNERDYYKKKYFELDFKHLNLINENKRLNEKNNELNNILKNHSENKKKIEKNNITEAEFFRSCGLYSN